MSAITETERGGELVCITAFSARPRDADGRALPSPRREFRVGEHVRFLTSLYDDSPADNPIGHMVIFEPLGDVGRGQYMAVQNYFVSLDCWNSLATYFRDAATDKRLRGSTADASGARAPKRSRTRP